jgi:cobalt-zinc-cadmium efflux system protein
MSHSHSHNHAPSDVSDKVLLWSVIINFGLSGFEFGAGLIAGSVALMADALHNTNDAAALLIAYIARKVSRKSANAQFTFGYKRAELIGALIQLTALILVGLYLIYESIDRFWHPQPLRGNWIMMAAGIALVVDLVTVWLLWAMSKGSLNVKAAFLHNLSDAGASLVVLLGGGAILLWDVPWLDPLMSLLIAGVILKMSWGMMKETVSILMESAPPGIDTKELKEKLESVAGVKELHHIHVWRLDEHHAAFESHVLVDGKESLPEMEPIKRRLKAILVETYDIQHSTLEFETAICDSQEH